MKIRHIHIPIIASALTICSACEKELDFRYHDIPAITVIEGAITAAGSDVTITQTTPMDEPTNRTHITDASVTLTNLDTEDTSILLPDDRGNFVSVNPGIPGDRYRLTVTHDGHTYSSISTMTPAVDIQSLEFSWIDMPYDQVAILQIAFADNNPDIEGDCYWIRLYRNGAAYMWKEIKDNLSIDGIIYEVIMTSRRDTEEEDDRTVLTDGDVINVTVTQISPDMHDYLAAISSDSNGPSMFTGDFCLGYFIAGEISEASIEYHPADITGNK